MPDAEVAELLPGRDMVEALSGIEMVVVVESMPGLTV
jgi:hypothetical protein